MAARGTKRRKSRYDLGVYDIAIFKAYYIDKRKQADIAKEYGISQATVSHYVNWVKEYIIRDCLAKLDIANDCVSVMDKYGLSSDQLESVLTGGSRYNK